MGALQSASKVHVLSHSMGNRVSSEALMQPQAQTPNLGQLIFAAADVDAKVFAQRLTDKLSGVGALLPTASSQVMILFNTHLCHSKYASYETPQRARNVKRA